MYVLIIRVPLFWGTIVGSLILETPTTPYYVGQMSLFVLPEGSWTLQPRSFVLDPKPEPKKPLRVFGALGYLEVQVSHNQARAVLVSQR